MRPRLFRNDATEFSGSGYGVLTRCISCTVTEELGVAPTLEMEVLIDDPLFVNVMVGNIVGAMSNKNDPTQAFVIEEVTKPINGIVTVYATHIAQHRGKLIPVAPFTASTLDDALTAMVSNSLEDNPFTLVRDSGKNNVTATMAPTVPHSFRELMGGVSGSILDTYRGEWAYNNFTCTLYNKRGRDNGARIMYGKNMSDFNLEEQFNWNDSATGAIGYWVSSEDGTTVIGDIQYSEYADQYPYNKTVCVDFSDKFETAPSVTDLNTYTQTWINGKGLFGASVDVEYESINVEGGADVGIGDVVHIFNGVYNFEMESRVVGLEFDVLSEEYTNVTIGQQKTTLNEAISDISGSSTTVVSGGGGEGGSSVKYFLDQTVSSWESDATYPLYPYRGFISITGVSSADGVEVAFSDEDADSGNYSPICQSTTDGVYIWAKTQPSSLTIPTIAIAVNSDIDLQGEAPYLSTEHGGTVNGDVTINGTLTATAEKALYLQDPVNSAYKIQARYAGSGITSIPEWLPIYNNLGDNIIEMSPVSKYKLAESSVRTYTATINWTLSSSGGVYAYQFNPFSLWGITAKHILNIGMAYYSGAWRYLNFYPYGDPTSGENSEQWVVISNQASLSGTIKIYYF